METAFPRKWLKQIETSLAATEPGIPVAGEVQEFCDRLVAMAAATDWRGYWDLLGDARLPTGYSHVRVAIDGSHIPDGQIYAMPGRRVSALSALLVATANGRRSIDRIRRVALPEGVRASWTSTSRSGIESRPKADLRGAEGVPARAPPRDMQPFDPMDRQPKGP